MLLSNKYSNTEVGNIIIIVAARVLRNLDHQLCATKVTYIGVDDRTQGKIRITTEKYRMDNSTAVSKLY